MVTAVIFLAVLLLLCVFGGIVTLPAHITDVREAAEELRHPGKGYYSLPENSYVVSSSLGTANVTDSTAFFSHTFESFLVSARQGDAALNMVVRVQGSFREQLRRGKTPTLVGRVSVIGTEADTFGTAGLPRLTVTHSPGFLLAESVIFFIGAFLIFLLILRICR